MEERCQLTSKKRTVNQSGSKVTIEVTDMGKPRSDPSPFLAKERKSKRERWLLTRKTWRYMADAGRRLIPEGVYNRQEDVPKIEAYFQEVCQREPKFLLWRKSSYPGALTLRTHGRRARPRKKGGSYREKASSADEAEELRSIGVNSSTGGFYLAPTSAGRFDLFKNPESSKSSEDELLQQLESYLQPKSGESDKKLNHEELFEKLQKYLQDVQNIQKQSIHKHRGEVIPEPSQKELLDTLRRHFSKSTNREAVISNLLTDRKLLENLYFGLRKTRGFRGTGTAYLPEGRGGMRRNASNTSLHKSKSQLFLSPGGSIYDKTTPVIEVEEEANKITEITRITKSTQTLKIHTDMMKAIEEKLKKKEEEPIKVASKEPPKTTRRRSSLEHDDVSPSVSDTIKRYLKMARKKSVDSDKKDRFRTINYDETLRNIKPKGEIITIGNDDGLSKGIQTELSWVKALKDFKMEDNWVVKDDKEVITILEVKAPKNSSESLASSAGSQTKSGLLSSGQTFLSNLLHGRQHSDKNSVLPTAMQKSKSSTSVGRNLVSKKIWRGRSKSQSRLSTTQPCSWTPQGNCIWSNLTGKQVTLTDTNILQLSEVERRLLQKVALAKLQAFNIGCNIQIPSETVAPTPETKPKRRPHLLKRKAITTSFFDTNRGKDKETTAPNNAGGMVFGVPLGQVIENERLSRSASSNSSFKNKDSTFPDDSDLELRRKSHHGSRTSFSSLMDHRTESAGSTESLGSSVPGLLDAISVGSTADIPLNTAENEHNIPNIVSSCLRHIETRGLHTLGIFRVSSSKKRVRQLREDFDSGKVVSLDDYCPHDVATLLKEYFRDLPEPLLCKDLYQPFVLTQKLRNRKLQFEAMQHLIQLLPVPNRDTLWSLLNFLALIAANCDDHNNKLGEFIAGNKMDSNNLATLFAPNILHCSSPGVISKDSLSAQSCEERIDVINVIRSLIDNYKSFFQVSAELLDEVYLHMMDTHPEALDQLLRKREAAEEVMDDPDSEALEEVGTGSDSSSLPQSPKNFTESQDISSEKEEKKIYSRRQFLHEKAGFESLQSENRYRARDKERSKSTVERKTRRESDSRLLTEMQSQHLETKSEDEDHNASTFLDSSGIVKASLTIPTSSFNLNLDDSDIPYMEDSNNVNEGSKHQMTLGTVRNKSSSTSTTVRYRSINGSDSSQTSIPAGLQAITGSLLFNQTGYDSAVGSSATISSPPRYTTTPSVCSSSDREYFSSNTSWASSPPLSPDSQTSIVDELSDDTPVSTIGRMSIPTRPLTEITNNSTVEKEDDGEIVKITIKPQKSPEKNKLKEISRTSETRRSQGESDKKQESSKSVTKDFYQRVHSLVGGSSAQATAETLTKSVSSSQLMKKSEGESESGEWGRKVTTSISNIGGAVMRSKTADIERMLKLKPETKKSKTKTEAKMLAKLEADKKYSKRRYTDSRHSTKQIADFTDKSTSSQSQKTQSIWKRREIISSPSKGREDS